VCHSRRLPITYHKLATRKIDEKPVMASRYLLHLIQSRSQEPFDAKVARFEADTQAALVMDPCAARFAVSDS